MFYAFRFLLASLIVLLTACAPGPDNTIQLAAQGLLSGELSAEGDLAVTGSVRHGGSLWDIQKGERLYDWNHKPGEYSLLRTSAISGDGKTAVTTEEDTLVVWDTTTGKSKNFWQSSDRILAIKLNWKGDKALIGTAKGEANYFDLVRGGAIYTFNHSAEIRAVDLDKDAKVGITASDDKTAKIWDLTNGENIRTITLTNHIKTVALSPSGTLAFTTAQREDAVVWDIESGAEKFNLTNRYTNYTTAEFSADEQYLTAGTFQGEVKRWKISSGEEVAKWKAKPRKEYGSAASKAIIDIVEINKQILVLTSDGLFQSFKL